jgi:two-component system, cell cycle sensor histidine kinase and response regulator CckA
MKSILVVDDEKNVVGFLAEILALHGYAVHRAESAREALEQAADLPGRLDLLLSDVVMPGMNGKELAGRIARIRPETKVLFMSAYSDEIITSHGVVPEGVSLIRKPFRTDDLLKKIEAVLSSAHPWSALHFASARSAGKGGNA